MGMFYMANTMGENLKCKNSEIDSQKQPKCNHRLSNFCIIKGRDFKSWNNEGYGSAHENSVLSNLRKSLLVLL